MLKASSGCTAALFLTPNLSTMHLFQAIKVASVIAKGKGTPTRPLIGLKIAVVDF